MPKQKHAIIRPETHRKLVRIKKIRRQTIKDIIDLWADRELAHHAGGLESPASRSGRSPLSVQSPQPANLKAAAGALTTTPQRARPGSDDANDYAPSKSAAPAPVLDTPPLHAARASAA